MKDARVSSERFSSKGISVRLYLPVLPLKCGMTRTFEMECSVVFPSSLPLLAPGRKSISSAEICQA